jgi:hypothetical protein
VSFAETEKKIVDYFESTGCDVEQDGVEWFLSLYDEGPSISLTALAIALSSTKSASADDTLALASPENKGAA